MKDVVQQARHVESVGDGVGDRFMDEQVSGTVVGVLITRVWEDDERGPDVLNQPRELS